MFPFRQSCEFSFQVCGNNNQEDDVADLHGDLLASAVDPITTTNTAKATADFKRKRGVEGPGRGVDSIGGDDESKKLVHRDNERQRRVVMSGLVNTLRSLLPLQFIKGKRSMSDHICETENYIKHLEKNIKELENKRNMLRTLQSNSITTPSFEEDTSAISSNIIPCTVNISITNIGLDIHISSGQRDGEFRLSAALNVLLEQGISVVCSVSCKVDRIFHHNIQCQVIDNIDIQRLQQRLYDVVCSNSSSLPLVE